VSWGVSDFVGGVTSRRLPLLLLHEALLWAVSVTIVLARLVLNERIWGVQKSGVALALTGVALAARG